MEIKQNDLVKRLSDWGADPASAIGVLDGDAELYFRLMMEFVDQMKQDRFADMIDKQQYRSAFASAHEAKGVAANLALHPLYDSLCSVVEDLRYEVKPELSDDLLAFEEIRGEFLDIVNATF